ncbi:MAG: hypothetical protein WDM96_20040 [Lacunisphaera sp.]
MNNLGMLYYHGVGVTRDLAVSLDWYTKAGDAGFVQGRVRARAVRAEIVFNAGLVAYNAGNYSEALAPVAHRRGARQQIRFLEHWRDVRIGQRRGGRPSGCPGVVPARGRLGRGTGQTGRVQTSGAPRGRDRTCAGS